MIEVWVVLILELLFEEFIQIVDLLCLIMYNPGD